MEQTLKDSSNPSFTKKFGAILNNKHNTYGGTNGLCGSYYSNPRKMVVFS